MGKICNLFNFDLGKEFLITPFHCDDISKGKVASINLARTKSNSCLSSELLSKGFKPYRYFPSDPRSNSKDFLEYWSWIKSEKYKEKPIFFIDVDDDKIKSYIKYPKTPLLNNVVRLHSLIESSSISRYRSLDCSPIVNELNVKYLKSYCTRMSKPMLKPIIDQYLFNKIKKYIDWTSGHIEFAPRSIHLPELYIENLSGYFGVPGGLNLTDEELMRFRLYLRKNLKRDLDNLRPLALTEVFKYTLTHIGSKAAGYPYCMSKKNAIEKLPNIVNQRIGYFQNSNYPSSDGPFALAFARTYEGGKTRAAWGLPLEVILTEGKYCIPIIRRLIEKSQDKVNFASFGIPYGLSNMEMYYRLKQAREESDWLGLLNGRTLSFDFSAFDMTINEKFIKIFFEELIECFYGNSRVWVIRDLKAISEYFINTPILLPDGNIYVKKHGIPSGSFFTNILGSYMNMTISQMVFDDLELDLSSHSIFYGDDSYIITSNSSLIDLNGDTLGLVSKRYSYYGLLLNPDKTKVGIKFLSRDWSVPGIPRTNDSSFKRLFFPEKNRRYQSSREASNVLPILFSSLYPNLLEPRFIGRMDENLHLEIKSVPLSNSIRELLKRSSFHVHHPPQFFDEPGRIYFMDNRYRFSYDESRMGFFELYLYI